MEHATGIAGICNVIAYLNKQFREAEDIGVDVEANLGHGICAVGGPFGGSGHVALARTEYS